MSIVLNKQLKIVIWLIIILMLSVSNVFADTSGVISSTDASGVAGDTVTVPVNISNNPGIVSMQIKVEYDTSKLTLIGLSNQEAVLNEFISSTSEKDLQNSPYFLTWLDGTGDNNYTNGTIVNLKFKVDDYADATDYEIIITCEKALDKNFGKVNFSNTEANVTVLPAVSVFKTEGNKTSAEVRFTNTTGTVQNVYYALYDSFGKMIGLASQDISNSVIQKVTFPDIKLNGLLDDIYTQKLFFIDQTTFRPAIVVKIF